MRTIANDTDYQALRPQLNVDVGTLVDPQVDHPLYNALSFICLMAAHNITTVRKTQLNFRLPGEDPALAGLWATYHRHAAQYLRQINQWIQENDTRAFSGIMYLVNMDVDLSLSLWRAHLDGYFALVEHLGGVQAVLSRPVSPRGSFSVIMECVSCSQFAIVKCELRTEYR